MRELKCRELGNDCEWGIVAETDEEILREAKEHAKVIHGRVELYADIETGFQAKIRNVKSEGTHLTDPIKNRLS